MKFFLGKIGAHFRLRHYRGHGIHSPFVYSLVREVVMSNKLIAVSNTSLHDILRDRGVARRTAIRIQNLHNCCGSREFEIVEQTGLWPENECTYVIAGAASEEILRGYISDKKTSTADANGVIVVVSPYKNRERLALCHELIGMSECVSIDNRRFIAVFYNRNQGTKHYKL